MHLLKAVIYPPFALTNVCMATAGIAAGKITNAEELVDIIGCPNYTTGGIIHYSRKTMEEICKTGKR